MSNRLNVGVIGLGRLGVVYARDLAQRVPNARLVAVAEKVYTQPGKSFEAGVAHAMVAVLSSPRCLASLRRRP